MKMENSNNSRQNPFDAEILVDDRHFEDSFSEAYPTPGDGSEIITATGEASSSRFLKLDHE